MCKIVAELKVDPETVRTANYEDLGFKRYQYATVPPYGTYECQESRKKQESALDNRKIIGPLLKYSPLTKSLCCLRCCLNC